MTTDWGFLHRNDIKAARWSSMSATEHPEFGFMCGKKTTNFSWALSCFSRSLPRMFEQFRYDWSQILTSAYTNSSLSLGHSKGNIYKTRVTSQTLLFHYNHISNRMQPFTWISLWRKKKKEEKQMSFPLCTPEFLRLFKSFSAIHRRLLSARWLQLPWESIPEVP